MRIQKIVPLFAVLLIVASCSVRVGYPPAESEPTVELHSSQPAPPQDDAASRAEESAPEDMPQEETSSTQESSGLAQSQAPAASSKPADKPAASSAAAAPKPSSTASSKPAAKPKPAGNTVEEGYLSDVEDRVLELINEERVENGLEELTFDYDLLRGARIRSKEMFVNKYFAHARPDGRDWSTIFYEDLDILTVARGENLAMVTVTDGGMAHQTARYWVSAWMNSVGHYANIMEEGYTHAAIGIYYHYDGKTYHTYATNLFARY